MAEKGKLVRIIPEGSEVEYILSATESFTKTESAKVTTFPIGQLQQNRSDHYFRYGAAVEFSGVISKGFFSIYDELTNRKAPDMVNYITGLRELLRNDLGFVTIHLPDDNEVPHCLITKFSISRDVKTGDGYKVSVSAVEVLTSSETEVTVTDYSVQNKVEAGDTPPSTNKVDDTPTHAARLL